MWKADDALTRKMRLLAEHRRTLVDQRTALTHTLADTLKQYFPQPLQWFGGEKSKLLRAILSQWPTLEQLQQAGVEQLTMVMRSCGRRKVAALAKDVIEKLSTAVTLTHDPAIIEGYSSYALSLIALIDSLEKAIASHDQAIAASWSVHPDRNLFDSLPGAGPVISKAWT